MLDKLTDIEQAEILDDVERCENDYRYFSGVCQFIANKQKRVVPLIHSYTQERMLRYMLWVYFDLNVQLRIIATKARRVMWTTLATSFVHWLMWRTERPDVAVFVGDKYETTDTIIRMYELMCRMKPYAKSVKSVETFEYTDSHAYCKFLSANSDRLGQSKGITHSVLTEAPYYRDGNAVQLSLLNAIDDHPLTTCFIEGTGNGRDPFFYAKWVEAIDHAEEMVSRYNAVDLEDLLFNKRIWDGSFIPLFTAFHEVPEYRRDPEQENVLRNNLTDDELSGMETYGWDEAQVAWRRYMIREKCGKDVETFNQEFPSCWKDAFKYSGGNSPWFKNTFIIDKYLERTDRIAKGKIPKMLMYRVAMKWKVAPEYDVRGRCTNTDKLSAGAFIPNTQRETNCLLWEAPVLNTHANRYYMGVDIAEGLAQKDYTVIYVYDWVAGEFVFQYRGHINHEDLHELIAQIGVYYGFARVFVEHNNHGAGVIGNLKKIYPLHLILKDKKETKSARNGEVPQYEQWYGQKTNAFNKRHNYALLRGFIDDTPEGMLFHRFYIEASTLIETADGKHIEAENKSQNPGVKTYDDCIDAASLALRACELGPPPVRVSGYSKRERMIYGRSKNIVTNVRDL